MVPSRYVVGIVNMRGHGEVLSRAVMLLEPLTCGRGMARCAFYRGGGRWLQREKEGSRPLPTIQSRNVAGTVNMRGAWRGVTESRYVVGIVSLRAGHAPPLRVTVGCVFFRDGGRWLQCEKERSRPFPTIQSRNVAGIVDLRAGHAPPLRDTARRCKAVMLPESLACGRGMPRPYLRS